MTDKNISEIVYSKFDLSTQAIILPKKNICCLYFEFIGNDFLIQLFEKVLAKESENFVYLANGYRSDISMRHFLKMNVKNLFFRFITSEDHIFKDNVGTYRYDEFKVMGVILTNENFSWLIHRDPDFGTITFAYNINIDNEIIDQLTQNNHYVGNVPKPEFYTDEI